MAADERTNKIFILTRPSNFGFFDNLIAELDAKVEPDVVMKVIELNYATAEDIASLLNSLITGSSPATPADHLPSRRHPCPEAPPAPGWTLVFCNTPRACAFCPIHGQIHFW